LPTNGPRILVVDDNEDNRYTLLMMLELDGYEHTGSAASGTEALALIEKESFGVVLLDMMMPDLNGDVVLRQIKTDPKTRDVSVIMISADTDAANVARCIELGADDYLPKPFNPSILRARITSSLQKHALRRLEAEYTATIEAEKRRSEGLLLNVLPREIAFRLLGGESNLADFFEDATVIFADVVGFTRLTAMMRPDEIVACLNRLFTELDVLAEEVGVEKIKTIGDCYMAVAGVPSPREEHKCIATGLALRMVAAADRLGAMLPAPFLLRVGIHSGPVMAGVIGSRKFAYDVWGDTVNIASRLEGASRPKGVLVSATTASGLGAEFRLEGPHLVETKDWRAIEAFFVSGASD
jgi:adenylate cyclase